MRGQVSSWFMKWASSLIAVHSLVNGERHHQNVTVNGTVHVIWKTLFSSFNMGPRRIAAQYQLLLYTCKICTRFHFWMGKSWKEPKTWLWITAFLLPVCKQAGVSPTSHCLAWMGLKIWVRIALFRILSYIWKPKAVPTNKCLQRRECVQGIFFLFFFYRAKWLY